MMNEHPCVRLEERLTSVQQWLEKKQHVVNGEVRLLAMALHQDIIVITANSDGSYARRFPCGPTPLPKMNGGSFVDTKSDELCVQ